MLQVQLTLISCGVQRRALLALQVFTAPSKSVSTQLPFKLTLRLSGIIPNLDCPQEPMELMYVACESLQNLNGQPPEPPCDSFLQQQTTCTVVFSTFFCLLSTCCCFGRSGHRRECVAGYKGKFSSAPSAKQRLYTPMLLNVVASRGGGDAVGISVGRYVGCYFKWKSEFHLS